MTDPPAALNHPILHVLMWKPSLVEAPSHISIPWLDLTLSQAPERKFNPVQGKRKHTQAAFLNMRLYHTYPMPQVLSLYLWRWIITCVYLKPVFFLGIIIFYGEINKFTVHKLTDRITLVYNKVQDDDLNVGIWRDVYSVARLWPCSGEVFDLLTFLQKVEMARNINKGEVKICNR